MSLPPHWREDVGARFPELRQEFDDYECDTPYLIWFQLRSAFERAYEQSPPDEAFIRRIYLYYDWCARAPRGKTAEDDLLTCVCVCFLEHIPEHPAARADMPRWFPLEELLLSRGIFSYMIGVDGFAELEAHFRRHPNAFVPWSPPDAPPA